MAAARRQWVALIHVAKKALGLDDDAYRAVLERVTKKTSAAQLDDGELRRVVDEFKRLGFVSTSRPKPGRPPRREEADPTAAVTPAQQAKMKRLYGILGWTDAERQRGWSVRQCGHAWPQTRDDARKVIEGLRFIGRRQGLKVY
jgi:hypothetical protein